MRTGRQPETLRDSQLGRSRGKWQTTQ